MSEVAFLVESVKNGNHKAQKQLYDMYSKAMYNICLRMMNDEDKAKDALQEGFINVFTHIDAYNFEASIGAWIKRIIINKCIDTINKEKKTLIIYKEDVEQQIFEDSETEEDTFILTIDKIQKAIKQLPEGYRIVFTLFALEEYSHKQIAQLLQVSENTSKSQYFKAKKMIKSILKNG